MRTVPPATNPPGLVARLKVTEEVVEERTLNVPLYPAGFIPAISTSTPGLGALVWAGKTTVAWPPPELLQKANSTGRASIGISTTCAWPRMRVGSAGPGTPACDGDGEATRSSWFMVQSASTLSLTVLGASILIGLSVRTEYVSPRAPEGGSRCDSNVLEKTGWIRGR